MLRMPFILHQHDSDYVLTSILEPTLQELNLCYDSDFKVMICQSCQTAILPGDLVRHVRKEHQRTKWTATQLQVLFGAHEIGQFDSIPKPTEVRPPVSYLPTHEAFLCTFPHCGKILTVRRNIMFHVKSHGTKTEFRTIQCQRIFDSKRSPFFEVLNEPGS